MRTPHLRSALGLCLGLLGNSLVAGPIPAGKPSAYPDWWFSRDVIPRLPDYANIAGPIWPLHYAVADDYAAANIGQLKFMAVHAAIELDATLPGGPGEDIYNIVSTWLSKPGLGAPRDDYAALNQGQLKAIADLFYVRLAENGYSASPLVSGQTTPWTSSPQDDDAYALVNLGQLKHVFSFAPGSSHKPDTDFDGLYDEWEILHFGTLERDGLGDWNDDGLSDRDAFRFGLDPKGADQSQVTGKFDVFTYDVRGWLETVTITGSTATSYTLDREGNIELFQ